MKKCIFFAKDKLLKPLEIGGDPASAWVKTRFISDF